MELVNVARRFKPEQYELARAGYEAYRTWTGGRSVVTGDVLPGFDELLPKLQDAWAAAGEAMEENIRQQMGDTGELTSTEEGLEEVKCPSCGGTGIEYSGVCHCGEEMNATGLFAHDGHTPVEMTRECVVCRNPSIAGTEEEEVVPAGYDWDLEADKLLEKEDLTYETADLAKNEQV